VPISSSPQNPLYPLHRLVFDQNQPSPADNTRAHLVNARNALDRASAATKAARSAELDDALYNLAAARQLLPRITDENVRVQLDTEIAGLEQHANEIGTANQQDNTQGPNSPDGQNGQNGNNGPGGSGANNGP
jgi:hypothetical protein